MQGDMDGAADCTETTCTRMVIHRGNDAINIGSVWIAAHAPSMFRELMGHVRKSHDVHCIQVFHSMTKRFETIQVGNVIAQIYALLIVRIADVSSGNHDLPLTEWTRV